MLDDNLSSTSAASILEIDSTAQEFAPSSPGDNNAAVARSIDIAASMNDALQPLVNNSHLLFGGRETEDNVHDNNTISTQVSNSRESSVDSAQSTDSMWGRPLLIRGQSPEDSASTPSDDMWGRPLFERGNSPMGFVPPYAAISRGEKRKGESLSSTTVKKTSGSTSKKY
ncbi:hypothetical protein BDB01DRAFT_807673 [Pilobolus umbonatus]|nr:hypothetical protein BDB01DRAFT_807673 [Pilobolus umbonatus]